MHCSTVGGIPHHVQGEAATGVAAALPPAYESEADRGREQEVHPTRLHTSANPCFPHR